MNVKTVSNEVVSGIAKVSKKKNLNFMNHIFLEEILK